MNQQKYRTAVGWVRRSPERQKIVTNICRLLPCIMFFFYAAGSICIFSHFMQYGFVPVLLSFWLVPAAGLIFVSILRRIINAPRPYERFDFQPLLHHDPGASFPSKHASSAFLISGALFWLSSLGFFPFTLSCAALICAVLTAVSRVAAGVHFPKDVIAGGILAFIFSLLGYLLI